MTLRLIADAAAQTTVSGTITNVATSIAAVNTANFPVPVAGQQSSLIILDTGNVAFSASSPLATNYEYVTYTTNTVGTNTISGITRGQAGTTAKSFSAGATIAVPLLAEDIVASAPWKFDEQTPTGASVVIPASGSIPASYLGITYRTIRIRYRARSTSGNQTDFIYLRFNADAGANYDFQSLVGAAAVASATSTGGANQIRVGIINGGAATANKFAQGWIEIFDFSNATAHKTALSQSFTWSGTTITEELDGGDWLNTAAITSVTLLPSTGNWAAGTLFTTELSP